MAKYVFPAIIEKADDGYNVSFPDIENCFTCGKTFAEAIEMAQDVLPLMLCQMEDDKTPIPEASDISALHLAENETVTYIVADTMKYREKYNTKAVKKTLTIPQWMIEAAAKANINFSQVLQDALREKLSV